MGIELRLNHISNAYNRQRIIEINVSSSQMN